MMEMSYDTRELASYIARSYVRSYIAAYIELMHKAWQSWCDCLARFSCHVAIIVTWVESVAVFILFILFIDTLQYNIHA